MKKKTPAQKAYSRIKKHFLAYKTIDKVSDKDLPVFVPIGRGHLNKKAVGIMNKCMENNSEQQIIIKNASKKLTKEILKTGIGKQVQLKEHAPLGNVPIAPMIPKDHLKKCTNILIDGMTKEGAKKMRNLVRVTNYKTGQTLSLPTINEREAELSNAIKKGSGGFLLTDPKLIEEAKKKRQEPLVWIPYNENYEKLNVQPGWNNPQPKKKRIPTRFNAKKLKEKHPELWEAIESAVHSDIEMQANILISEYRKNKNVAENAAFTAIVEMIKRGLL